MKKINQDLKTKAFMPAYLLYGDEGFLLHSYKTKFKSVVADDNELNYSYFEGKDIKVDQVIAAADTLPFFCDSKLIIVEDSGWFKSAQDKLVDYLSQMPETSHILFIESEVDKRNKLYKKVSEIGYVCEMNHPAEGDLSSWAARILKASDKQITSTNMQLLISRTGIDMQRLKGELEKLIAFTAGRNEITKADIEAITAETEQNRIFDMVRAIVSRRKTEALKLYDDLLALKEPPLRIIFLIARQFNQMLEIKDMMNEGENAQSIAAFLKQPAWSVEKSMKQLRGQNRDILKAYVERCVELEEAVKKGDMPDRIAVEILICM